MGKEGLSGIFNSKDAKVNIFTLIAAVFILLIGAYLVEGAGTITFKFGTFTQLNATNLSLNFSTASIQINVTATVPDAVGTVTTGNTSVANITINITYEDDTPFFLNGSITKYPLTLYNNSVGANLSGVTLSFNITFAQNSTNEGVFIFIANSTLNKTEDGVSRNGNFSNITIRLDFSSPVINVTNSNNLTNVSGPVNTTGSVLNFTLTAYDLVTGIHNITLHRNGTLVNFTKNIGQNATTTINYVIRGADINQVLNFTINVTDFVGRSNQTDGVLITMTKDGTPPGPISINASLLDGFNQSSSTAPTFNFTATDNNDTEIHCNITIVHLNDTSRTFYANITNLNVTSGNPHLNTTSIGLSNGTYNWNVTCADGNLASPGNTNESLSQRFTVDAIAPVLSFFNFTNATNDLGQNGTLGSTVPSTVPADGAGTWAQGRRLFGFANFSDNLTRPSVLLLQFYNVTGSKWETVNTTSPSDNNFSFGGVSGRLQTKLIGYANLSFVIPSGRAREFEGKNVSFRFIANDTLGNLNSTTSVRNITIQINDTFFDPVILINGTVGVNGSNITDTRPLISWNISTVNEIDLLIFINVSVDRAVASGNSDGCGKYRFFDENIGATVNAQKNRNGSFQVESSDTDSTCPLGNGSHLVTITVKDSWGNSKVAYHNFTVQSGTAPGLSDFNFSGVYGLSKWNKTNINGTNITSLVSINLSGYSAVTSVDKLTYVSSCNTSETVVFNNGTAIFPFNKSSCDTLSGNRTLTVTVNDTAGNSNSTTFTFLVDNVAPSMAVNFPTNGQMFTNENISLNLSVLDNDQAVSFIGYYLDDARSPIKINMSEQGQIAGPGVNVTVGRLVNHTGTHTIKFTANDSLGNAVNGSAITVTMAGPINLLGANRTIRTSSGGNVSNITFFDAAGIDIGAVSSSEINQTLKLFAELNESAVRGANLTIQFNGSAANWNKTDKISFIVNNSDIAKWFRTNQSAVIIQSVLVNRSIAEFLSDNNSYFGKVSFGMNVSLNPLGGQRKLFYFADELNLATRTNITECPEGFSPTATQALSEGTFPCWNTSNNKTVDIFVPHFSVVVFANDTDAPTINVTIPQNFSNVSVAMFVPNITVSPDAVSCKFIVNGSAANETMGKSGNVCLGSTQRFKNSKHGVTNTDWSYNINFTVEDSSGNINNYVVNFNVTDDTPPNTPNSTRVSVSVGTTTATVTISDINESVNASVQSNGSSSFTTGVQTDYNRTQAVSLTGLTASTKYTFNVTVCDFAGNCAENSTGLSFTTSAAEAAAAAAAAASSGGGGGGTATPSAVTDSKAQVWSKIPEGSSVSLNVNKADIAVTQVAVNDVKSELSNVEIEVASLDKNPVSEDASSKVYQYLRLTKKNLKDADAASFTVAFRVTKAWLTKNSLASGDVALFRYSNGWNELTTRVASTDTTYVNYEANTPGFSSFAIGAKSSVAPVETPKEEAAPEEEKAPEAEAPEKVEKPEPVKAPSRAPTAWIIAAIVVILGIVLIVAYQKNKKKF